jgi:hypothetical protein
MNGVCRKIIMKTFITVSLFYRSAISRDASFVFVTIKIISSLFKETSSAY